MRVACPIDWVWEDPNADDDESSAFGFNDTFEDWPEDDDE
jgi:hypothetical protein